MRDLHNIDAIVPRYVQYNVVPNRPDAQVLAALRACLTQQRMPGQPTKVIEKLLAKPLGARGLSRSTAM